MVSFEARKHYISPPPVTLSKSSAIRLLMEDGHDAHSAGNLLADARPARCPGVSGAGRRVGCGILVFHDGRGG